jgi:hypothetical protein
MVRGLLAADAGFANAALGLTSPGQAYRLARKKAFDAVALLSGATRRLADEPNINRKSLAALTELLGANYLLASDLASMPVLVKLRGTELASGAADQVEAARVRVLASLSSDARHKEHAPEPAQESMSAMEQNQTMELLTRRLAHIEHTAERVARLAARPMMQEDG